MQEENKTQQRERKIVIILLLLIILLLILFFLISNFGRIEVKIPTGNIDIFDITFIGQNSGCNCCKCGEGKYDKGCTCECCKNTNNSTSTDNGSEKHVIPLKENNFSVYDSEKTYSNATPLNIFSHRSYYTLEDVIAPGTENSYQFIARNNNDFAIKYDWKTVENNEYNINMKYRLKLNGKYIIGNSATWVTADEIKENEVTLADKSYNVYTLEWKWFESENDTEVGIAVNAYYKLNIEFFATQY